MFWFSALSFRASFLSVLTPFATSLTNTTSWRRKKQQVSIHICSGCWTGMTHRSRDTWSRSTTSWYRKGWAPAASGEDTMAESYTGWSRREGRGASSSDNGETTCTLATLTIFHPQHEPIHLPLQQHPSNLSVVSKNRIQHIHNANTYHSSLISFKHCT